MKDHRGQSVGAVAADALLGAIGMGCGTSKASSPPRLSTTEASASTSAPTPTSTTVAIPSTPQPSAEDAADVLVSGWASANQAKGLTVATSQAVATLFADPYPSGLAISRGCSAGSPPVTCTYGPPGGGSSSDPIFQIEVSEVPTGWYVSSVQILG